MPEVTHDIICVIDCDTIVNSSGIPKSTDPTKPNGPISKYVWLVAKSGDVIKGQATEEMTLQCKVNDTLRWRCVSTSANTSYMVYPYEFVEQADEVIDPQPELTSPSIPVPNPKNLANPTSFQTVKDFYFNAVVSNPTPNDNWWYTLRIAIYDDDANLQGYYWWDPYLVATRN